MAHAQGRTAFTLDLPIADDGIVFAKAGADGDAGTFEGLAATFGDVDLGGDLVEPGAFAEACRAPQRIRMLWQHDPATPIGVWEAMEERGAGLWVKGRLILEVQQAREAYALMKSGALDALSIGFSVPQGAATIDAARRVRRLKRIDLWEISPVTFAMNPRARISGVKAAPRISTIREFEAFLRNAGGFSHRQAKAIAAAGYRAALSRDGAAPVPPSPREEDVRRKLMAALQRRGDVLLTLNRR